MASSWRWITNMASSWRWITNIQRWKFKFKLWWRKRSTSFEFMNVWSLMLEEGTRYVGLTLHKKVRWCWSKMLDTFSRNLRRYVARELTQYIWLALGFIGEIIIQSSLIKLNREQEKVVFQRKTKWEYGQVKGTVEAVEFPWIILQH